jgi:phage baseplate assembly protein W
VTATLDRDFLGVGWAFPIRVNPKGGLSFVKGAEDIRQSIWLILSTAVGERVMLSRFGCGIHDYVFTPNSPTMHGNIAHQVRRALTQFEPRVDVQEVTVQAGEENVMLIRIDYRIRSTNAFHNLVFPFYITEGTGV